MPLNSSEMYVQLSDTLHRLTKLTDFNHNALVNDSYSSPAESIAVAGIAHTEAAAAQVLLSDFLKVLTNEMTCKKKPA